MDKIVRNVIERATQQARKLLDEDFSSQLEGTFDVLRSAAISSKGGPHLSIRQQSQRDKIVAAIEHKCAAGMTSADAIADYVRDAAFTTLNRFVALKMLEARQLVQECITKGEQSAGYREFCGMAPGLPLLPSSAGYRLYIESLFDELSTEVKVLFDRQDPSSVLWPNHTTFERLLEILNDTELSTVWGEDETIGWVYQFFNSQDERRNMREESPAPRNGRELAVRNQFFTPRYVVEFLVDNTLGRIWYEMEQGQTRLVDQCKYLVRRPGETFGSVGVSHSATPVNCAKNGTLENPLANSVVLPLRAKKDPRDLLILDPACGSGHFLLYAFDLLISIYEEAWDDGALPASQETGHTLRHDYPHLNDFHRALPGLILRHNLHGIDIDLRATQIAALALWMRAQRAWNDHGIAPADRPRITKTNIVVAESMQGEAGPRHNFIKSLEKQLGELAERVFSKMELASDVGSLLNIEDEIRSAIRDVYGETGGLFRESDEERWNQAESALLTAIRAYAEEISVGNRTERRLFADDAARGFSFIDVSRARFDVIIMNPPFGDPTPAVLTHCEHLYQDTLSELMCTFLERSRAWLRPRGIIGVLGPSQANVKPSVVEWRMRWLRDMQWECCADLGGHVLDGATVRVAAHCITNERPTRPSLFFRLVAERDSKSSTLLSSISELAVGRFARTIFGAWQLDFLRLLNAPLAYWFSGAQIGTLSQLPTLEPTFGVARVGLQTSRDEEFVRCIWEVPEETLALCESETHNGKRWVPLAKGGEYSPYAGNLYFAVDWEYGGKRMRAFEERRKDLGIASRGNSALRQFEHYFKSGITYTHRTNKPFAPRLLPASCIFGVKGPAIVDSPDTLVTLGVMSSRAFKVLIGMGTGRAQAEGGAGANSYDVGLVRRIPFPHLDQSNAEDLALATREAIRARVAHLASDETSPWFEGVRRDLWKRRTLLEVADQLLSEREEVALRLWHAERRLNEIVENAYNLGDVFNEVVEDELGPASWCLNDKPISNSNHEAVDVYSKVLGGKIRTVVSSTGVPVVVSSQLELAAHAAGTTPQGLVSIRRSANAVPSSVLVETAKNCVSQLMGVAFGRLEFVQEAPQIGADVTTALDDMLRTNSRHTTRGKTSGILVDDPGHRADVVANLLEVANLGSDSASFRHQLEQAGRLGDLRTWIKNEFFDLVRQKYSSGPRKAPVYWQLASTSADYSIWLYYHRLTKDTFYALLNDYVVPKVQFEERKLASLIKDSEAELNARRRKEIAKQESVVEELRAFRKEVARIAPLWNPNIDDGVLINFALLWRLVPHHKDWQKELKATWGALCCGDYDWSHLAMHLWPERVIPKCATDRSLAIAHGLEDVFWVEGDSKWKPRPTPTRQVVELVHEGTSVAVKSALKDLLEAPVAMANAGRGRGRRAAMLLRTEGATDASAS